MFADMSISPEMLGVVSGLVVVLWLSLIAVAKLLLAAKDKQIELITSERNSYRDIATLAVTNLEKTAHRHGIKDPVSPIAAVVAEHDSPATKTQQETAELQTLRAKLVAATLNLGLPPRIGDKDDGKESES